MNKVPIDREKSGNLKINVKIKKPGSVRES